MILLWIFILFCYIAFLLLPTLCLLRILIVIIIVLFENIFRVTVVRTVLQSMPQLLHVYPSYLPYTFTLPVLDSTCLTSLLDMKHKIVLICCMSSCRTSGA